jgi:hypothetical protein
MAQTSGATFENIESAHEYVGLLCEALDEATEMIEQQLSAQSPPPAGRHLDALRLVDYKLHSLREHMIVSRRLLSDLRTLRRYLLGERFSERAASQETSDRFRQATSDQSVGQV